MVTSSISAGPEPAEPRAGERVESARQRVRHGTHEVAGAGHEGEEARVIHVHGAAERVLHGVAHHLARVARPLRQRFAEARLERLPGLRHSRRFFP